MIDRKIGPNLPSKSGPRLVFRSNAAPKKASRSNPSAKEPSRFQDLQKEGPKLKTKKGFFSRCEAGRRSLKESQGKNLKMEGLIGHRKPLAGAFRVCKKTRKTKTGSTKHAAMRRTGSHNGLRTL
jgi:hypothetical protein